MAKKYKLKNTNLYHNGKFVAVGSIVELNDKDAAKLSDVLVEVKEKTTTQTNTSKTATNTNKSKTATTENTKKEDEQTEGGNS